MQQINMGLGMQGGVNFASQPQHLAIEDKEILKDCAGCSQVIVGNFCGVKIGMDDKGTYIFLIDCF
jgi:hypothetical protein